MKVKRLVALAACVGLAAVITSTANASTTLTPTITVKWNTQSINVATLVTDYTVAGGVATGGTAAVGSYFQNQNGGTGTCMGVPAAMAASTVDFENVTPDNSGTASKYTDCYFKNAVNLHVFTTDGAGYKISVAGTTPFSGAAGADVAGGPYLLCVITSGAWANNVGAANAANSNFALAAAPTLDNGGTNTCAHAGTAVNASDLGFTAATTAGTGTANVFSSAAATGANGADFSGDMELGIPTLAAAYAGVQPASVTLTYSVLFN
jgi:hypothetical protein